jgi:DNA-binding transcriptional LysR family regulator
MHDPDLNLLYVLDALLRTGSVKMTGERLNLSATAVSHALARLRELTQDPLFVRAGRALTSTERARALADHVHDLTAQGRKVLSPAADDINLSDQSREFKVRLPEGLGANIGVSLLTRLRSKMGNAKLLLLSDAVRDLDALRNGAIDLEVRQRESWPTDMQTQELLSGRMMVVVRSGHPIVGKAFTLRSFAKLQWVCLSEPSNTTKLIEEQLRAKNMVRDVSLRVATPYAVLAAASESDFAGLVPESLTRSVGALRPVHAIRLPVEAATELFMVWHRRADSDPGHVWLRTCLLACVKQRGRLKQDAP